MVFNVIPPQEYKLKPQCAITVPPPAWLTRKGLTVLRIGKDLVQLELAYLLAGVYMSTITLESSGIIHESILNTCQPYGQAILMPKRNRYVGPSKDIQEGSRQFSS